MGNKLSLVVVGVAAYYGYVDVAAVKAAATEYSNVLVGVAASVVGLATFVFSMFASVTTARAAVL